MNKLFFPKQIVVLLILTIVLNIARIFIFDSTYFVYLFWNLFLAVIPFVISSVLFYYVKRQKLSKPLIIFGSILWLFFLPNAPYIVTDLIHLGRSHAAPLLYDTFLIFTSAWVGLLLGLYSMQHMERILRMKYSAKATNLIMVAIIFGSSFGMYLGRFMRFNSWDIISDATFLFTKIGHIIVEPSKYIDAYIFTALSFIFIYMFYRAWKYSLIDSKDIL